MILMASDPGLANSAFVTFMDGVIVESQTFTTKADGRKVDFVKALARARVQADAFQQLLLKTGPDHVVIEGYEDFGGGYKRTVKDRWTTPLVLARFDQVLDDRDVFVHWQLPSVVLGQLGGYKHHWAAGRTGLFPGDHLVTNDHERSAAVHGIYALSLLARNRGL